MCSMTMRGQMWTLTNWTRLCWPRVSVLCARRCVTLSVCCYRSQSSCKIVTRRMPKTAASCGGPPVPTSIEPVTTNYCLTNATIYSSIVSSKANWYHLCLSTRFRFARGPFISAASRKGNYSRAFKSTRFNFMRSYYEFFMHRTANYCTRMSLDAYRLPNATISPKILNLADDCRRFSVFSAFRNGFRRRLFIIRRGESNIINLKRI